MPVSCDRKRQEVLGWDAVHFGGAGKAGPGRSGAAAELSRADNTPQEANVLKIRPQNRISQGNHG